MNRSSTVASPAFHERHVQACAVADTDSLADETVVPVVLRGALGSVDGDRLPGEETTGEVARLRCQTEPDFPADAAK